VERDIVSSFLFVCGASQKRQVRKEDAAIISLYKSPT